MKEEPEKGSRPPRILAAFGGMVVVSGMERMSFEVLRVLRDNGAAIHCILNSWENHRIVPLAEAIGASWSTGSYSVRLVRHSRNPLVALRMGWDITRVSAGLLRDAARFRPTHVFLPEFMSVLRNAPALLILRAMGVRVICRLANHPDPGPFYQRLFRDVLTRFVDIFVANSRFATGRLLATGVEPSRIRTIFNTLSTRPVPAAFDDSVVMMTKRAPTILSVGQIAPFKGTHLFVLAMLALLPRHQSAQALIIGRKPQWPPEYSEYVATIERQIADAGMEKRILFVGQNENIPDIMRASKVLALPILQEETFGNVALEALSAGLPVVAFASGGITELVDDGVTGILCETPTVDSLVNGIDAFLTNPEARDRASVASLARYNAPDSPYSRNAFVHAWTSLFAERN